MDGSDLLFHACVFGESARVIEPTRTTLWESRQIMMPRGSYGASPLQLRVL